METDSLLTKQVNALEQEKNELKKRNERLEMFSSIVAHDLKSPLNSMTMTAEFFKDEYSSRLDPDGREILQIMIDSTKKMRSMIDELLELHRAGGYFSARTQFSIQDVLQEVLTTLHTDLVNSQASVEVGEMPSVYAERLGLVQVFQNLVSNCIKYRGEDPLHIHIRAINEGQSWRFEVEDNGPGISLEDQVGIFEPFKRIATSRKCEGTGLGLAICKRIVEVHQGVIGLRSEVGQGTTMYFSLPMVSPLQH